MKPKITLRDLNKVEKEIMKNSRYGSAGDFRVYEKYPKNDNPAIVVLKIAYCNMTNSTQLSRLLGNKKRKDGSRNRGFYLQDIVKKIVEIDFDERVKNGDLSLVSDLALWSKNQGVNLFSFFSKYCKYHNELYRDNNNELRSDYSIFDSVVCNHLEDYLNPDEISQIRETLLENGYKIGRRKKLSGIIESMRNDCDFEGYQMIIDEFINIKKLTRIKRIRHLLDHYIWYLNR
jgi:hypothetical protein